MSTREAERAGVRVVVEAILQLIGDRRRRKLEMRDVGEEIGGREDLERLHRLLCSALVPKIEITNDRTSRRVRERRRREDDRE